MIGSGRIVADGVIDERSTNRTGSFNNSQTAAHFLENAAEILDERVMNYLDAAVALNVLAVDRLDGVMTKLHTLRTALRQVWEALGNAGPTNVRLLDCGEGSLLTSGSVA